MPRTLLSTLKLVTAATVSALLLSACIPLLPPGPGRGPMPLAGPVAVVPPAPAPLMAPPGPRP